MRSFVFRLISRWRGGRTCSEEHFLMLKLYFFHWNMLGNIYFCIGKFEKV